MHTAHIPNPKDLIFMGDWTEKGARIETELNLANTIQKSMLPSIFPPFPEHKEIDIYASMIPAKEVGGDFYDFYFVNEDTLAFLESALDKLGLTRREANEFIVYWLPLMQDNPYNVISFQTDAYTDSAILDITPTPDSLLRVFMAYYPSDREVEIEPQTFEGFERQGFVVVEWGGSEIE